MRNPLNTIEPGRTPKEAVAGVLALLIAPSFFILYALPDLPRTIQGLIYFLHLSTAIYWLVFLKRIEQTPFWRKILIFGALIIIGHTVVRILREFC